MEGGGRGRKVKKGVTYYLDGPNHTHHLEINILALPKKKEKKTYILFLRFFANASERQKKAHLRSDLSSRNKNSRSPKSSFGLITF